jgi:hypothetical protein
MDFGKREERPALEESPATTTPSVMEAQRSWATGREEAIMKKVPPSPTTVVDELVHVTLERSTHEGFGLGVSFNGNAVMLSAIGKDTPAGRCGQMLIGDRLVSINGEPVNAESDFGELLTDNATKVTFVLSRVGPKLGRAGAIAAADLLLNLLPSLNRTSKTTAPSIEEGSHRKPHSAPCPPSAPARHTGYEYAAQQLDADAEEPWLFPIVEASSTFTAWIGPSSRKWKAEKAALLHERDEALAKAKADAAAANMYKLQVEAMEKKLEQSTAMHGQMQSQIQHLVTQLEEATAARRISPPKLSRAMLSNLSFGRVAKPQGVVGGAESAPSSPDENRELTLSRAESWSRGTT